MIGAHYLLSVVIDYWVMKTGLLLLGVNVTNLKNTTNTRNDR